ncbi:hypothetical protein [Streptomyces solicathayae]|uniref:Uncharacterized protein n=1 Tax=Streptomyces solicathayae TaxID=3081768 RepID=A0ABZ0LKE0_9ACTN|nr:hypothetical protein [Streptomyces sp. HUAS YS2]WOX19899.1 hypothetical protein R2D22_00125 [Streptomyces sp. HUAS YS2]
MAGELADCAHRLLATATDPYRRVNALNCLEARGCDISGLETEQDRRLRTELNTISDEPPF